MTGQIVVIVPGSESDLPPPTPDPFLFESVIDADGNSDISSNEVEITGLGVPGLVSISGGLYSQNGGVFTSERGTAVDGDTFVVLVRSSTFSSTVVEAVLSIGLGIGNFSVTTGAACVISAISSGIPLATTATITWTTSVPASSEVEYGPTISYGSSSGVGASLVTSHSMGVSGLSPNTIYHFRVKSTDARGITAVSGDQILITNVRYYDLVNRLYTNSGSTTTEAAAITGTVRTFTDAFLGDNWGAHCDPANSNLFNVDLNTAVTGTIGSGGTLPTGMSYISSNTITNYTWSAGQITFTTGSAHALAANVNSFNVVGVSPSGANGRYLCQTGTTGSTLVGTLVADPGSFSSAGVMTALALNYDITNLGSGAVRIRAYGTCGQSSSNRLLMASSTGITTAVSTSYTISWNIKQIGPIVGPTASANASPLGKGCQTNTSAGAFVSSIFPVGQPIRTADGLTVQVSYPITTPATGARIQPIFAGFNIPINGAVDYTVELSNIQVTLGAGMMAYTTNASPISADDLTINNLSSLLSADLTTVVTARLPPDNYSGTIIQMGSGSNRVEVTQSNYAISINVVNAGVSTATTLGLVIPWMRTKAAISLTSGVVKASLNGKPAVLCGVAPSLTGMSLGKGGTAALRGSIEACAILSAAVSDADLAIMAMPLNAMYDDFDRADGAVGQSWTGQTYEHTGTAATSLIASKRVVTTDSGGATTSSYFLTDMGAKPKISGGAMAWENAAGSASAGVITTPNDTSISQGTAAPGITALANHFLTSSPGVFAGKFLNNALTDHQWNFSSTAIQLKDGATIAVTAWKMRPSDGVLAVRVHNGETVIFTDENYYAISGQYSIFESFWGGSGAGVGRPIWANWGTET